MILDAEILYYNLLKNYKIWKVYSVNFCVKFIEKFIKVEIGIKDMGGDRERLA